MITGQRSANLKATLLRDIEQSHGYVPQRGFLYNMIIEDFVKTLDDSDAINDAYIKTNIKKLSKFLTNYLSTARVNSWIESVTSTEFKRDGEYQLRITEAFEEQLKQENKNAAKQQAAAMKYSASKIQGAFRDRRERVATEEIERGALILHQLSSGFFTQSLLDSFVEQYAKQRQDRMVLEQAFITAAAEGNTQLLNYTVLTLADKEYLTPESLGVLVANGFYRAAENNNIGATKRLEELAAINPALLKIIKEYNRTYDDVVLSDDVRKALTAAITNPQSGKERALAEIVAQSRKEFLSAAELNPRQEAFRPLEVELQTALVADNKSKIDDLLRRIEEAISKASNRKGSTSRSTTNQSGSSTSDLLRRIEEATSTRPSRRTSRTKTTISDGNESRTLSESSVTASSRSSTSAPAIIAAGAPKNVTLIDSLKGVFKRAAMKGKVQLMRQITLSLTDNGFQKDDFNRLYIESFEELVNKGENNNSVAELKSMLISLGNETTSTIIQAIDQYKAAIPSILASTGSVRDNALVRLKRQVMAKIESAPIIASLRSASSAAPAPAASGPQASRSRFHR